MKQGTIIHSSHLDSVTGLNQNTWGNKFFKKDLAPPGFTAGQGIN